MQKRTRSPISNARANRDSRASDAMATLTNVRPNRAKMAPDALIKLRTTAVSASQASRAEIARKTSMNDSSTRISYVVIFVLVGILLLVLVILCKLKTEFEKKFTQIDAEFDARLLVYSVHSYRPTCKSFDGSLKRPCAAKLFAVVNFFSADLEKRKLVGKSDVKSSSFWPVTCAYLMLVSVLPQLRVLSLKATH